MNPSLMNSSDISGVENGMEHMDYFFNQIISTLPTALYSCNSSGIINFFNQKAVEMWGSQPVVGIDMWCGSYKIYKTDGTLLPRDFSPMALTIKEGKPIKGQEIIIERPTGEQIRVLPHPQLILDENEKILGAYFIMEEISGDNNISFDLENENEVDSNFLNANSLSKIDQAKIHEENLGNINSALNEKNQELQKINIDLDNFIYIASHDLKTPVANIEGLLSALTEVVHSDNSSKEEINTILGMMRLSIDKFLNTVQDLTTITKIQQDIEEEIPEQVDLMELIEDIKMLNGDLIANSGAKIFVNLEKFDKLAFSRKNLKSILFNLITNAIKYRSPDRNPEIHISTDKKDNYHIIEVNDNGLGLEPDNQKKLFSMYKRFHDHVEGSGIGLYLVKRIIDNAGGNIEVESQKGLGSTFKLYFKILE